MGVEGGERERGREREWDGVHGVSVLTLLLGLLEVASHERERAVNATSSRPTTGHLRG